MFGEIKSSRLYAMLDVLRPGQFVKNILVLAGLFFAVSDRRQNVSDDLWAAVLRTVLAFVLFCMVSGAVYIVNDIFDAEMDRRHPVKCRRPIASGRLPVRTALFELAGLLLLCAALSPLLGFWFSVCVSVYFVMQVFYTVLFKRMVIVDVFVIAAGFVLRVYAGTLAAGVRASKWLIVCTFMGALFLALCKRRSEKFSLGQDAASHREVLGSYDLHLLDHLVAASASSTVICYAIYTLAPETVSKFGTDGLCFTIPFVLFGVFRYMFLVMCGGLGGRPEKIFTHDCATIVNVAAYFAVCWLVFMFGGGNTQL